MVERILELNRERTIFWSLLGILFLCIGFYMYFINATVHNIVFRQSLESEATKLTPSIGNQEFEYITKRNAITLPFAYNMGFKETFSKTFISKKSSNTQVSFLSNVK